MSPFDKASRVCEAIVESENERLVAGSGARGRVSGHVRLGGGFGSSLSVSTGVLGFETNGLSAARDLDGGVAGTIGKAVSERVNLF